MNVHLPIAPELPSAALPPDGRRQRIQPADVKGPWHRRRTAGFVVLIALWAVLPWIRVGHHPALFVDLEHHELYLFGLTFNPQDAWLLFFLLTGVGFSLVYATAVAGRAWCGWACPQTVFLDGLYRRLERWIEGPRERRLRRDAGPLTYEKVARKAASHAAFLGVSLVLAHIVLAYFASIPETLAMVRQHPAAHPQAFAWVVLMTALLYANFAWFREQLCVVLCPYGRLQASLLDEHSVVVGYDTRRGEPRGKKGAAGAGDCVDCKRCVVVCPTGIDIRNGVQMECIACTACVDACDDIMSRLGRPRGLVRYDSLEGLAGRPRRFWRPRIFLYTGLLLVGAVVALLAGQRRADYEVALLRLPGQPYVLDGTDVRDAFQVHLVNKRPDAGEYTIEVAAAPDMTAVVPISVVTLAPLADARLPVFVSVPRARLRGEFPVEVRVRRTGDSRPPRVASARFLGPQR